MADLACPISVVIPCYNRSALLKRAIDSALGQDVKASEIIVVDDGSTDNTKEVCAGYRNRIEYIWQPNSGASTARNNGVVRSRSPWIAFLDSDDFWRPSHLAKMVAAIKQTDGQARFYFCDLLLGTTRDALTLWQKIDFRPPREVHLVDDGTSWAFLKRQPTMLQCSVFRRDAWMESGGLDPRFRLMHDPELFFRLSVGGKVCAVSGVGCVQTDDDIGELRLTTAVHPDGATYWKEQIALWQSVLRRCQPLSSQYRRVAQFALASARWRLFRLCGSADDWLLGVGQVGALAMRSPRFLLSLLISRRSDGHLPPVVPDY
jgi:hypothetical protein